MTESLDELIDTGRAWWRDVVETFGMDRCVRRVPTDAEFARMGEQVLVERGQVADLCRRTRFAPLGPPPAERSGRFIDLDSPDVRAREQLDRQQDEDRLAARRGLRLVHDLERAGLAVTVGPTSDRDRALLAGDIAMRLARAGLVEVAAGGVLRLTPAGHQAATAA